MKINGWTSEEVGHNAYVVRSHSFGFSMELPVQKQCDPVLCYHYTRNTLLESACEAISEKQVKPIQPLGHCGVTVLSISIYVTTGFNQPTARCCPSRSVSTILHQSTGDCSSMLTVFFSVSVAL